MDAFDTMKEAIKKEDDGGRAARLEAWRVRQMAAWAKIKAETDEEKKRVMIQDFLDDDFKG